MTRRRVLLSAAAAAPLAAPAGTAQAAGPHRRPPDPALRAILKEIDPDRIEATVRRLAAFGTRHTLSSQDDPVRGIGAARDWIHQQLQTYAAASGGRMTVELQ